MEDEWESELIAIVTRRTDEFSRGLDRLAAEAISARFSVGLPEGESSPVGLVAALRSVRGQLDRVEGILARLSRVRATVKEASSLASAAYQDAWDRAAHAAKHRPSGEFTGPRERYADFDLSAMGELRDKRRSDIVLDRVDGAIEVVRTCHRGLDSLRQDIATVIRAMNVGSSLERER